MAGRRPKGTGSVRQRRPGVWQLRWAAGTDPLTGKPVTRSKTVEAKSKAEAQKHLTRLIADDAPPQAETLTVAELCDLWLEASAAGKAPRTVESQRSTVRRHIVPWIGHRHMVTVTPADLDQLYAKIGQTHSAQTVRHVHWALSAAYRHAYRRRWIDDPPTGYVELPPLTREQIRVPTLDELARLLDLADTVRHDLRTLLVVALGTGARLGEIVALRWEDVDLEARTVRIVRSVTQPKGGIVLKSTKTRQTRAVSFGPEVADELYGHADRLRTMGVPVGAARFLFSDDGFEPNGPNRYSVAFRKLRDLAGVDCRFHDLRHAHATRLIAAGLDVRTVSGRLGHAKTSTTLDVYAHAVDEADRAAGDLASSLFHRPRVVDPTPPGGYGRVSGQGGTGDG